MIYFALSLISLVFIELLVVLKLPATVRSILQLSREARTFLRSSEMDDDEKEMFMRRGSVRILKATVNLITKFGLAMLVSFAVYLAFLRIGSFSQKAFANTISSPLVLSGLTAATVLYTWARYAFDRRLRPR